MSVATTSLEGHEAYLHTLDRALRVAIVASLVLHVALAGLLPSPFHHEHPMPQTLEVELVATPPVPAPASVVEPPGQPPPAVPAQRPPDTEAQRQRTPRPHPPPRKPAASAPAPLAPEAERVLTHEEPAKAVTAVPAPPTGAETPEDRPPAPPAKAESSETGPVAPPSFRAGYLRNPEPVYPTVSRRLGEEGTVQLRVLVSAEGQPVRVDLHRSSSHPRLDEAAAAAVRGWRFVPAKRGTTPVEATVIVPIVFRLEVE